MSLAMDNFRFDVTAWKGHLKERDLLAEVMAIAFVENTAKYYLVQGPKLQKIAEPRQSPRVEKPMRLIFYWHKPSNAGAVPLPFQLDAIGAADWAKRWLAEVEYGPEPDHDGDNSRGWRVYNEEWRHIDGESYAICAIEPAWAMHGK